MNKVYGCLDGRSNTNAVVNWAAWAAQRLGAPLELLHVLERHPERVEVKDYSGAIGLGAQESLLQTLSDQDEQHSKQAREAGRRLLAAARDRAASTGALALDVRLRHGDFVDTVVEMQSDASLFVLGEHDRTRDRAKPHAEHHLERALRAVRRPVLVASARAFEAPRRFVIGFDGSANARKAVDALASYPLVNGLPALVAMVGRDTPEARRQLQQAGAALAGAGFAVETELFAGEPQHVLPDLVEARGPALLVVGAYGHSRLHRWLLRGTTATLLRLSDVPVLILR